jgi:hypothetical protein
MGQPFLACLRSEIILIQSWNRSGSPAPVWPDRTRPDEKFIRPDETRFLFDFFRFFCRIFASLTPKMNRPDFNRTGPDGKNPSGSNSVLVNQNELFF